MREKEGNITPEEASRYFVICGEDIELDNEIRSLSNKLYNITTSSKFNEKSVKPYFYMVDMDKGKKLTIDDVINKAKSSINIGPEKLTSPINDFER